MSLTTITVILFLAFASSIITGLLIRQRATAAKTRMEVQLQQQGQRISSLLDEQNKALAHQRELESEANQYRIEASRLETSANYEESRVTALDQQLQQQIAKYEKEQGARFRAEKLASELSVRLQEQEQHHKRVLKEQEDNKQLLKQEFSHLAKDILEERGKIFSSQQEKQLEHLLKPFRTQLSDFRNKVEEVARIEGEGRAALKNQLESLHTLNQKITDEAGNLAKALKGDKKLQGNWGELQVERILESSGLVKGAEYEREPNFKDDEGQNKRPDFIVHLPESKHLIIDSKVSLVDYLTYTGADTEAERESALGRHVQCVRQHIKSLSEKDYPSLPEMKAPDFVFMFMPVEPAFLVAFQKDQQLFNEAFEKRIVVVTPTTMLATLRTVANLWTIERQNANTKKLANKARQVYDKLRVFTEKMEKLDTQITNARSTYDDAMGTLKHGRGNLISQADQFLELGVRVKKELPRKTLDTADLETPTLSE